VVEASFGVVKKWTSNLFGGDTPEKGEKRKSPHGSGERCFRLEEEEPMKKTTKAGEGEENDPVWKPLIGKAIQTS